jgi:hypothetical protein
MNNWKALIVSYRFNNGTIASYWGGRISNAESKTSFAFGISLNYDAITDSILLVKVNDSVACRRKFVAIREQNDTGCIPVVSSLKVLRKALLQKLTNINGHTVTESQVILFNESDSWFYTGNAFSSQPLTRLNYGITLL